MNGVASDRPPGTAVEVSQNTRDTAASAISRIEAQHKGLTKELEDSMKEQQEPVLADTREGNREIKRMLLAGPSSRYLYEPASVFFRQHWLRTLSACKTRSGKIRPGHVANFMSPGTMLEAEYWRNWRRFMATGSDLLPKRKLKVRFRRQDPWNSVLYNHYHISLLSL